jgi:hypothetical protein
MESGAIFRQLEKLPNGVTLGSPLVAPGIRPRGGKDPDNTPVDNKSTDDNKSHSTMAAAKVAAPTPPPTTTSLVDVFMPTIAIINESTVLSTAEIAATVAAIQIQLNRDFAPVWGVSAHLKIITNISELMVTDWLMTLLDDSDQANALGYHDLTDAGLPIGKIFAKTDAQYGLSWSVTLSHELLEMLLDPYIINTVFDQTSNTGGKLYAFEVCDAIEDDNDGYKINNIQVSDFIYPAWFESWRKPGSTKFDFTGKLTHPLSLAPQGYISIFPIPNRRGWVQAYGETIGKRLELKIHRESSRTVRRMHGGAHAMTHQITADERHEAVLIKLSDLEHESSP